MRRKIYVGLKTQGGREVFKTIEEPSLISTPEYFAVIGPFKTIRGANYMVEYGQGNPHIQNVSDAERISKQ